MYFSVLLQKTPITSVQLEKFINTDTSSLSIIVFWSNKFNIDVFNQFYKIEM